jgi:hypothetical protein
MDEAERFVRDAMSFAGFPPDRPKIGSRNRSRTPNALKVFLQRFRIRHGGSDDPFAYVGASRHPKPPSFRGAIRLPLP